ncbi:uncharacterized protein N7482_008838 [Penicillium canariense]|uniref:SMODS and SLOG-associating 2TM effector domain-containing protein n=1 Tax=Penicillium canariense TaxID=189055 RepID=A0A9W9LIX6_9EURO|nr:uncharacterized protein N7482_008838 [Penicillium canariense]KAJ5157738.1 hypothetical protein N7482_008838 [Penicillium canariense]
MSEGSKGQGLLRRVIEAALLRQDNTPPPIAAHAAAAAQRSNSGPYGSGAPAGNGMPDLEQGGKRFTSMTQDPELLIPPNDKLLIFRALTGIDSVPALTQGGHLLRTAPNVGIYTRVVTSESQARQAYTIFNYLINTCLGIQIVVAAALTALGAASGPHAAITAFGAINTIVAGILTYLRGSGLPDRLKSYENKWKNIREYIEQREREFCLVGCDLDVQEEVFIVESMYQNVKSEMESTKSSGEGRQQQPDDPRIRRSLLPPSNNLSGHRNTATSARRPEAQASSPPSREGDVSPIAVPEHAAEKI